MKFNQLLVTSISLMLITFTACKKNTQDAYCENGLLRSAYKDCKCSLSDEYILPTSGNAAECRKLGDKEWIFTFNDAEYPFKQVIFEYWDTSKVTYPNSEVIIGYEAESSGYSMFNLKWKEDGHKEVPGTYYISYDENWNASVVIDFRYRWAENESSSFSQSTKEGFFITLQIIDGKPVNVRLNRGEPLETESRNVVSYTPVNVSK